MFVTFIDGIFAGATTDIVQLRFTWAISRDITEVKSGDAIGVFKVVDASNQMLRFENDASVDLSADSTVTLARNFVFRIADDADFLRFMPDMTIARPGTYEDRGFVLDEKTNPTQLAGGFTWDAQNFGGFWYDLDDGESSETLELRQTGMDHNSRKINDQDTFSPQGGLVYTTARKQIMFEVSENLWDREVENALDINGVKQAEGQFYGKLGWMGEEFVAVNGNAKKLAKLLIEQEEATAEKKTLTVGESWQIGDWILTAQSIDAEADPRQAWLVLSYKGQKLDDRVVNQGEVYTYIEKSIAGESGVPMFVTLIDGIFARARTDMVQLRFTWAISRDVTEIMSGDRIGVFEIDATNDRLIGRLDSPIDLLPGAEITLAGRFKIKVANDSNFLRFYPMALHTVATVPAAPAQTWTSTTINALSPEVRAYEIRGSVVDENTPEGQVALASGPTWDARSFPGFWHDTGNNLFSETLKITQPNIGDESTPGKTRTIRDADDPAGAGIIYETTRQLVEFKVSENKGLTVENSLDAAGIKFAAGTHYGKLGLLGGEFVALNGKAKKLTKLLIEQNTASEKKTLAVGESWQIGDWTLTVQSIDAIDAEADLRLVGLTLSYKGQKLDDKIAREGEVYTYIEESIAGERDVPMFVTLIDSISAVASGVVQLSFTWAISRDVINVGTGDMFGVFKVSEASDQKLRFENYVAVNLYRNSTVNLAGNLNFRVENERNNKLRFYPVFLPAAASTPTIPPAIIPTVIPTLTPTPIPVTTPAPTFINSIGMEFVLVPAGEFNMGSPSNEAGRDSDEGPVHRVKIANAFYMGKYEVTQKQWRDVMGSNPSYSNGDNLPVESISWNDVQDFIKLLNEKEGTNKYRLPSEAEWEYAARAGTTTRYSFGDDESKLGDYAWYDGNSGSKNHEVGQKKSNPWGLYDMHGNVWELVQDTYHNSYNGAPTDGSAWEGDGSRRVNRGGGWYCSGARCRSAFRGGDVQSTNRNYLGFRLLRIS